MFQFSASNSATILNYSYFCFEKVPNLSKVKIPYADLSQAYLKGVNFQHAQLDFVDFRNSDLRAIDFTDSSLTGSKFE